MGKVVVLLSGGLDSATTLAFVISRGMEAIALSFDYGQRHRRELESGRRVADHFGVKRAVFKMDFSFAGNSSLTSSLDVEDRPLEKIGDDIPATYVPARNSVFLSIGSAYAEALGCDSVAIGANALDYSGYPDCRPEYMNAMEKALNLGTRIGVSGNLSIMVPLQYLTKKEIIRLGLSLGVPFGLTRSCYRDNEKACGRCDSCKLRLRGFMEAGSEDPTAYQDLPGFYSDYLKERKGS
ncbi:MAG: 7-cyano-7-deazaguanine synthase QueC [Candidatus Thermoplasmatota archaeon]|jgi:7-cyano-7-deazaguanine synthase|nr:7-cyano-7-deazaguanine synthase QueC [Candidatus Thermoplasmatota archaeon]MCL5793487.1 7-cyano-7-deazaguanine synthase QueC [Candidatus Thermoplasmatota archaeon]